MSIAAFSSGSPRRAISSLVTAVFQYWRSAGIQFLVLRNYAELPERIDGDLDLMVLPAQAAQAEHLLMQVARQHGFHLHNRVEFLPVSLFFYQGQSLEQIQFDLFTDLRWRGFSFFSARKLLERSQDKGLFCAPHPAHEAVNSVLTRQIYQGYVKDAYKPGILKITRQHAEAVRSCFAELFGNRLASRVTKAILVNDWKTVEAQTAAMRAQIVLRGLTRQPIGTVCALWRDLRRLGARLWQPPGLTLVMLGPDGCGKSSAANQLSAALDYTFKPDKSLRVHWKPVVFFRKRRSARMPSTNPHGGVPRGRLASLFALFLHWTEYWLGHLLQLVPVRFRNGLVLIDRYHYDFVVDPRRYRLNLPAKLTRVILRLMPNPDLVFLLDAAPEVLQSRKCEVTLAETTRQREAYRALAARLRNATVVDASQPSEEVVRDLLKQTLGYMRQRQLRPAGTKSGRGVDNARRNR